jgi:hypothetical protein
VGDRLNKGETHQDEAKRGQPTILTPFYVSRVIDFLVSCRVSAGEKLTFELKNTYAQLNAFDWNN